MRLSRRTIAALGVTCWCTLVGMAAAVCWSLGLVAGADVPMFLVLASAAGVVAAPEFLARRGVDGGGR